MGSKSIPGHLEERQSVGEQHRRSGAELLHLVSFRRSGVIKNKFIQSHREEFGQCRLVVALGELWLAMVVEWPTAEQRNCSGLVFDTARKQYLLLNVFFRLGVLVRKFVFS